VSSGTANALQTVLGITESVLMALTFPLHFASPDPVLHHAAQLAQHFVEITSSLEAHLLNSTRAQRSCTSRSTS
jgi:hypothetical protein